MAKDHFRTHPQNGKQYWNFNILVGKYPDVARMQYEYAPTLTQLPGLYDPIPTEWLHMTILTLGTTDDYTEEELLHVADVLAPKLAIIQLPELAFDSWWQWGGNIVFHISPHDELSKVYDAVIESLREVIGDERTTKTPHGHFIPHTSLAYTRDHHDELATNNILAKLHITPAHFSKPSLGLLRQWATDGHYEWEVVR